VKVFAAAVGKLGGMVGRRNWRGGKKGHRCRLAHGLVPVKPGGRKVKKEGVVSEAPLRIRQKKRRRMNASYL